MNQELLAEYKAKVIDQRSTKFEDFTRNITLICHTDVENLSFSTDFGDSDKILPHNTDSSIFLLQTIAVEGH